MIFGKLIGVSRVALIHEIWGCYHRKERRKLWGAESRMIGIMHFTRSYHWSKWSLVTIVEDDALGLPPVTGRRMLRTTFPMRLVFPKRSVILLWFFLVLLIAALPLYLACTIKIMRTCIITITCPNLGPRISQRP